MFEVVIQYANGGEAVQATDARTQQEAFVDAFAFAALFPKEAVRSVGIRWVEQPVSPVAEPRVLCEVCGDEATDQIIDTFEDEPEIVDGVRWRRWKKVRPEDRHAFCAQHKRLPVPTFLNFNISEEREAC